MSDVDSELLALAGGAGSSDEDEQPQRPEPSKRRSSHGDDESSGGHDEEDDAPMNISRAGSESRSVSRAGSPPAKASKAAPSATQKGTAARKTPAKKTAKRQAQSYDESEEEGEASSAASSHASLQSASMDESDSDSDSDADVAPAKKLRGNAASGNDDDDENENKYPVDGLFIDLKEKAEIMNMREVEREQILAERAQEKDRIHQNKLLRQLVSNDEQRKKRSASAADLDEGQRKTSRVRTKLGGTKASETSSAIDTLKARRAEKSERNRQREEDRERRKGRVSPESDGGISDDGGARGDDDDSEVEWAKTGRKSRSPPAQESQTPELRDIERVRLSRSRFSQVCFYPGFEQAITGTFVRVSIGPDPETREPIYRMAIIKGFTKGKPYALVGPQGQPIVTDQYVLAAHGKAQKEWPFLSCSDSPFTEAEWLRYQKVCGVDGVSLPKKGILLNKTDDINQLISRPWTEDELEAKITRQRELKNRFNGVDRMRLEYGIKEAKSMGNFERVKQLQEELDNLETPRLAFKTSLAPVIRSGHNGGASGGGGGSGGSGGSGLSQQERLAQLNAENRRKNADAVRKAQLKERARARAIERKIERGEEVEEDHSRRVKTRAKFVHNVNDNGASPSQASSRASTPANGGTPQLGAQKSGNSSLLPHLAKLQQQQKASDRNGLPTIHKPLVDDDIIAALDLDIDESILDD